MISINHTWISICACVFAYIAHEQVSDAGIDAMAKAGVVGVLLPTTAYILRLHPPPARKMIESGGSGTACCNGLIWLDVDPRCMCIRCHRSVRERLQPERPLPIYAARDESGLRAAANDDERSARCRYHQCCRYHSHVSHVDHVSQALPFSLRSPLLRLDLVSCVRAWNQRHSIDPIRMAHWSLGSKGTSWC